MPPPPYLPSPANDQKYITGRAKRRELERKKRQEQEQVQRLKWQTPTPSLGLPKETFSTIRKVHGASSPPALNSMKEHSCWQPLDTPRMKQLQQTTPFSTQHAQSIAISSKTKSPYPPILKESPNNPISKNSKEVISPSIKTPLQLLITTTKLMLLITETSPMPYPIGELHVINLSKTLTSQRDGTYQPF